MDMELLQGNVAGQSVTKHVGMIFGMTFEPVTFGDEGEVCRPPLGS